MQRTPNNPTWKVLGKKSGVQTYVSSLRGLFKRSLSKSSQHRYNSPESRGTNEDQMTREGAPDLLYLLVRHCQSRRDIKVQRLPLFQMRFLPWIVFRFLLAALGFAASNFLNLQPSGKLGLLLASSLFGSSLLGHSSAALWSALVGQSSPLLPRQR